MNKNLQNRLKSPVLWISIIGLIYSTVLVPTYPQLPEWTSIVGYLLTIFGITNDPTNKSGF